MVDIELRRRIELAIMGRTAPRAADAVMAVLAEAGLTEQAAGPGWRVGQHYAIHVYEDDRPVATFHDPADARRAVEAVNGGC